MSFPKTVPPLLTARHVPAPPAVLGLPHSRTLGLPFGRILRLGLTLGFALGVGLTRLSLAAPAAPATPSRPAAKATALTPPDQFELAAIDRYLADWVAQKGLPALAVTIVREGKTVFSKGYGHAIPAEPANSGSPGIAASPTTRFAIGSVSKQFTCVALLLLDEDGKLSVRDKVSRFYPGLTRANDITLLDLMHHVSGYPDYYPLDYVDRRMREPIDPDELLRRYAGGGLDFEPGSNYSYSNTGYILLARIAEQVSGEPFGAFLARRIFRPVGMTNTFYEPTVPGAAKSADGTPSPWARGHTTFALGAPEPVAPESAGWLGGAGGIWSTTTDLARWNLALFGGSVLKPASLQLLAAPRTLSNGRVSEYGGGLGSRLQNGRPVLTHSGAVSGFNAWNGVIPSMKSSLTMLCNVDGGLGGLPAQIFALLTRQGPSASPVPTVRAAPAVDVAKALFAALQAGKVDRSRFSTDFNEYLTPERLAAATARLRDLGRPSRVELISTQERGGMEVSVARVTCPRATLRTLMYRQPDGTIEQFFVYRD